MNPQNDVFQPNLICKSKSMSMEQQGCSNSIANNLAEIESKKDLFFP